MGVFYSASERGFFDDGVMSKGQMAADVVEITAAQRKALIEAQEAGASIVPDANGLPVAKPLVPPTHDQAVANLVRIANHHAARRINLVAPLWKQTNDNALMVDAAIGASVDPAELAAARGRRVQINAVRAASDQLVAAIQAASPAALATINPADDSHWPSASSSAPAAASASSSSPTQPGASS